MRLEEDPDFILEKLEFLKLCNFQETQVNLKQIMYQKTLLHIQFVKPEILQFLNKVFVF
jgi:hypothetical protein